MTSPTPLVSVAITSYFSEAWLRRALDSVLMQETDFPFEVVVGDDCSEDGSQALVRSYTEAHGDTVRLLAHPTNIGIQRNYYQTFEACRGKYIAWLDADDYWTNPHKLALQVRAMEMDESAMACAHYVRWVSPEGMVKRERYPAVKPGRYGVDEVLRRNIIASPSAMFRNGLHRRLPEWYFELAPVTDWPLWLLAAMHGGILLLDANMADYMLTPNSQFMGKGEIAWYRNDIRFYDRAESLVPKQFQRLVRAEKGLRYEALTYALRQQGDFAGAREAAIQAFRAPDSMDNLSSKVRTLAAAMLRSAESSIGPKRAAE
jgi:glycosyltransferase involved in cell wall biosynthesis